MQRSGHRDAGIGGSAAPSEARETENIEVRLGRTTRRFVRFQSGLERNADKLSPYKKPKQYLEEISRVGNFVEDAG